MSVTIHTTAGDLKCEIFCDTCPRTAFNFLALAASGKYNGTIFHRNIRGFMMQGGDTHHVTGKKSSIWGDDVTFPDEFHPNNRHDRRGRLSMANRGADTNKSQFFIIYEQQPHLDNMHTVFGQVLDGWDTLDKWERLPVWGEKAPSRSQKTTPLEPPEIVAITIHANPLADNGITYPTPDGPPEKK
ncbi:peptidyl-prolyl cis-trans isomerase [Fragilariopsis cylindrus CCMP1102]|uniref:Peptidyl-prolyl cis-trans isomerase n=1 Tax=Fragilariopsis cylindrus CCMP1102 TaxID=635003 RepID=A0A1E7FRB9_9STRA|nr:peptidyl-prolyl cis-trans isomerase [Fragilariopsis cylindrus CCMP1102]|eukprot:OEU20655.1 peptidyl-prolyl cis-trans isomerase [Fragilariopsis cylindrus CCMP1102]